MCEKSGGGMLPFINIEIEKEKIMSNMSKRSQNWLRNEEKNTRQEAERFTSGFLPATYLAPLSNFFVDMNQALDNTFRNFRLPSGVPNLGVTMFNPKVDIASSDNKYTISVEVPGLEERDIRLDVSADRMLTISGEKRQENKDSQQDVYCTECSYGAFERSLSIPDDVDQEEIEAQFKNGVLTIICPRTEGARQSRRQIPIGNARNSETARTTNINERNISNQNQKKAA